MDDEIREIRVLNWNLAEEYARHFHLPDKAAIEAEWQFRERIARSLEEMEEQLLAHEVLYNRRMTDDFFAYGALSSGYKDGFISQIAQQTELALQDARQPLGHEQLWQKLLTALRFWQKSERD